MTPARRVPGCRVDLVITERDRAIAREVADSGGTLTDPAEWAHTRMYEKRAMAWTRPRAEHMIRDRGWPDAHAHDDGSIYVPRRPQW